MMERFPALAHPLGAVALLLALLLTAGTSVAVSAESTSIEFRNQTDATVRIDLLDRDQARSFTPITIMPSTVQTVATPAGRHQFNVVAFRANPIRIHRIEVNARAGTENVFNINPHNMGLYLLQDADAFDAIENLAPNPEPEMSRGGDEDLIADRCRNSLGEATAAVIWNESNSGTARHYRRAGNYLCAVDGSNAFFMGDIYNNFVCEVPWRECRRNVAGDAIPLPLIRTSNVPDMALKIGRQLFPDAYFASTQTLDWLTGDQQASRLTTYFGYSRETADRQGCPSGYRPHYQGFCINIDDELEDDSEKGVRVIESNSE